MGIGIELPADQVQLKAHPTLTFEKFGYKWTVERQGESSTYTVTDGVNSVSQPIYYAFGAGMQTFVFPYRGKIYESTVSYFPVLGGLGITVGHEPRRPKDLVEALGRETTTEEITACFGCHSSGAVRDGKLNIEAARPGLDCEHCHVGATAHMEALAAGKTVPVPKKLGQMAAEEMSTFCGQCHRTWEQIVRMRQFGEANVRFQPYRIANSKCFMGNDLRLRCVSCHNPHEDAARQPASYDRTCLSCHLAKGAAPAPVTLKMQKACPVADKDCVTCHMPKRNLPLSPAVFTDHLIRIVRPGESYPN
jgi:Zn finger protein HypA/HybF involved in hydrogenase expression